MIASTNTITALIKDSKKVSVMFFLVWEILYHLEKKYIFFFNLVRCSMAGERDM